MGKSGKRLKITKTPSLSRLTISALFTALIAILAQFAVPLPFSPVPVTGQVIGVFVAGTLLGSRAGLLSITAYLMLGAAGAPVFSLGRGGLHMLTGPSGGYLWGFIPAVYIIGLIMEKSKEPSIFSITASMLLALSFIYLCGALQLALIMQYTAGQVLAVGVIPFLPLDLLKTALAVFLSIRIKKSLQQNRLDHLFRDISGRRWI